MARTPLHPEPISTQSFFFPPHPPAPTQGYTSESFFYYQNSSGSPYSPTPGTLASFRGGPSSYPWLNTPKAMQAAQATFACPSIPGMPLETNDPTPLGSHLEFRYFQVGGVQLRSHHGSHIGSHHGMHIGAHHRSHIGAHIGSHHGSHIRPHHTSHHGSHMSHTTMVTQRPHNGSHLR